MKAFFHPSYATATAEEEMTTLDLQDCLKKTRRSLEIAYAGFDYAVDKDLIDSYIYEIKALQKRYTHLSALAAAQPVPAASDQHSPIHALVSHVFG